MRPGTEFAMNNAGLNGYAEYIFQVDKQFFYYLYF